MLSVLCAKVAQNHLIETASASTGSLLIWDTGEYEMLPWSKQKEQETDDDDTSLSSEDGTGASTAATDSQKLHQAFQNVRSPPHRKPQKK